MSQCSRLDRADRVCFVLASRADLVNAVENVWSELEQEVDAMQEDADAFA